MHFLRSSVVWCSVLAVVACSGSSNSGATTITVDGSTALQPLIAQAAADYQAKHPEVTVTVAGGGSGKGLEDVAANAVDVGASDVEARNPDLVDHQVAVTAFAVVHGPNTGIESLTKAQIAGIFNGKIANWKQLGGHDQAVAVINRPLGSGTRKVFTDYIMGGQEAAAKGTIEESSEKVAQSVKNTPGAISYVGAGYAAKYNVPAIAIAGVKPTIDNVRNKTYGFWAYEHMYTSAKSAPGAEAFIDFVESDDAVIDRLGFYSIKDVAAAMPTSGTTPQ